MSLPIKIMRGQESGRVHGDWLHTRQVFGASCHVISEGSITASKQSMKF